MNKKFILQRRKRTIFVGFCFLLITFFALQGSIFDSIVNGAKKAGNWVKQKVQKVPVFNKVENAVVTTAKKTGEVAIDVKNAVEKIPGVTEVQKTAQQTIVAASAKISQAAIDVKNAVTQSPATAHIETVLSMANNTATSVSKKIEETISTGGNKIASTLNLNDLNNKITDIIFKSERNQNINPSLPIPAKFPDLSGRKINEITWLMSHNSTSYLHAGYNKIIPLRLPFLNVHDQVLDLKEQFKRGVRGFKIPLRWDGSNILACHGLDRSDIMRTLENAKKIGFEGWNFNGESLSQQIGSGFKSFTNFIKGSPNEALNGLISSAKSIISITPPCAIDPSTRTLDDALREIKMILDENILSGAHDPRYPPIITLYLNDGTGIENNKLYKKIEEICKNVGILNQAIPQSKDYEWPTVNEMLKNNQHYIIFLDNHRPTEASSSILSSKDFIYRPPYTYDPHSLNFTAGAKNFFCDITEGKHLYDIRHENPKNKMFLLDHYETQGIAGSTTLNHENNFENIYQRVHFCTSKEKPPVPITYLHVDYVGLGNSGGAQAVVDRLNMNFAS